MSTAAVVIYGYARFANFKIVAGKTFNVIPKLSWEHDNHGTDWNPGSSEHTLSNLLPFKYPQE